MRGNAVHGSRSAGAPFNVYLRNTAQSNNVLARGKDNQRMFVATYVLKAGDTMQEGIPMQLFAGGKYEIDVHGPNGFYRAFRGTSATPSVVTRCVYQRKGTALSGNVEARVKNTSAKPVTVTVADKSYKTGTQTKEIAPGEQLAIPVEAAKTHGWYDFTVQEQGATAVQRYAGRVETGRSSFTDPLMGGVIA